MAAQAAEHLLQGIDQLPLQLQAQFRTGILVEEYLVGPLVSAEIGVRDGQFYRFMVSDHPRARQDECIEMGASMPADLSKAQIEACFAYAEAVSRALGFDLGIFHVEMIVTEQGPVLVEMNSRLMGGVLPAVYRNLTGESIQDRLIDIHLGVPIAARPTYAGYVSARTIMPDRDGVLPARINLDWVREFEPQLLEFDGHKLEPGAAVKRLQVIGSYHVRATSFAEANLAAEAALRRFEATVGVPLIQ
jgi:biotin carboxylase